MKFKKVEIQAFRAYDKAVDATFDFRLENGDNNEVADFISIYAPNGFGKTSFYDAVEYGFTGSIGRLIKGKINKDIAKSERSISNKAQYILRNRSSKSDLQSKIKIETNDDTVILKEISSKIRANGTDFHFDETRVTNRYFQTVILSQEWIDAFLKVDEPTERYNKFMDFFGDKQAGEYLKCLTSLILSNTKNIDELKKSLTGVQKKLDFSGDKDILSKVNDKIIELNAKGENLTAVDERFSENQSVVLSNKIIERISDLKFDVEVNESFIRDIDKIFSGSDELIGLEKFFQFKEGLDKLKADEKELNISLENFNSLQATINALSHYGELLTKSIHEKENMEVIVKILPFYKQLLTDISTLQEGRIKDENSIKTINSLTVGLENDGIELKSKRQRLVEEQFKIQDLLTKIPDFEKQYLTAVKSIGELQDEMLRDRLNTSELELAIAQNQSDLNWINSLLENIKLGIFPSIFEAKSYVDKIKEIEEVEEKISKLTSDINNVENKISDSENLNLELEQFIVLGSSLVEKAQTNICLLCNAEYESFEDLSNRIIGSKFLSGVISDLLSQKNNLDASLNILKKDLNDKHKEFETILMQELKVKNQSLVEANSKVAKIRAEIELLQNKQLAAGVIVENYVIMLKGMTMSAFVEDTQNKLQTLVTDIEKLSNEIAELDRKIAENNVSVSALNEKIGKDNNRIKSIEENSTYLQVKDFLNANSYTPEIDLEMLLMEISKKLELVRKDNENLLTKKAELENILQSTTLEEVIQNKELNSAEQAKIVLEATKFEKEVENRLNVQVASLTQDDLKALINERRSSAKINNDERLIRIKNFELLLTLRESVEPYLKYAEAKKNEEEIKNRIKILSEKVRPVLEKEKSKVVKVIEKQIKAFFYEGLINDLYRRIDPHPDYKKIRFLCDFKEEKPKLNVYLLREDSHKDIIIPNLYFSTAQLNILSLSIFLAKALNAKDDNGNPIDCIFIDDPIQSMDSINILSTIDLIRSLVVNEEKQIILSTHDENFHTLLQKKIPSNYFKSKFLKLETFGKLELN